ncbi:MAG: hypothetical protein QM496_22140, partial [Verrucomicrobiota bacterium]
MLDPIKTQDQPKRFLPLSLKIIAAHILVILAILIPVGIHENRQAERDWAQFKTQGETKGEIFELKKLIPPTLPNDENFAASPIITELFDDPNNNRISQLKFYNFSAFKEIPISSDTKSRHKKMALAAPELQLKDYFDSNGKKLSEQEAAERMLQAYAPYSKIFSEVALASNKTGASYPFNYDEISFATPFTHLTGIHTISKALWLRSRAYLDLAQNKAASEDIITILQLANMSGEEAVVISHLVEITVYQLALSSIWQALESQQLSNSQLVRIENILKRTHLEQQFFKAIRNERAFFLSSLDSMITSSESYMNSEPSLERMILLIRLTGMEKAFIYRNKLNYCQFIQDHYLNNTSDPNSNKINIDALTRVESDLLTLNESTILPFNPNTVFTKRSVGAFKGIAERTLQISARIDLARVAIALELYRREHDSYPDSLSPLAPSYIDALPPD